MTINQTPHPPRSSHKVHQRIHLLQRHTVASRHVSVGELFEEERGTHADFDFGKVHANADCSQTREPRILEFTLGTTSRPDDEGC